MDLVDLKTPLDKRTETTKTFLASKQTVEKLESILERFLPPSDGGQPYTAVRDRRAVANLLRLILQLSSQPADNLTRWISLLETPRTNSHTLMFRHSELSMHTRKSMVSLFFVCSGPRLWMTKK